MRTMRAGFGMIELLIALALSSFIMLGMTQGYRNAVKLQRNAHELLVVNRRIALLFNQIERDFTTGVAHRKPVPYAPAEKQKKGEDGQKPEQTEETKKPAQEKSGRHKDEKKEPPVPSIKMAVHDDAAYRHRGKKWQTTKSVSLICTTPLELFGKQHERLVRVGYELVPDKKRSVAGKECYQLVRRQTNELRNSSFKVRESDNKQMLNSHVVAQDIKRFSIGATYVPKPPEKKEGGQKESTEKQEPVKTFTWAEKEQKKSSTALPEFVSLHIELWDENLEKTYSFECMIPCFVRDAIEKEQKEQKEEAVEQQEGGPEDEKKQQKKQPVKKEVAHG